MSKIPLTALERYPDYLNYLGRIQGGDEDRISSGAIAKALGLGEVLVRKDLAYTDCVGRPRVGYNVKELELALRDALRCTTPKNAVILGVGGLGSALLAYTGFEKYGISLACGFDSDPSKVRENAVKPVLPVDDIRAAADRYGAELAIICVPAANAQEACDRVVGIGIKRILTFAPTSLRVPQGVNVRYMDVAANLAVLASI